MKQKIEGGWDLKEKLFKKNPNEDKELLEVRFMTMLHSLPFTLTFDQMDLINHFHQQDIELAKASEHQRCVDIIERINCNDTHEPKVKIIKGK